MFENDHRNPIYKEVGADDEFVLTVTIEDLDKHMAFERYLEEVRGFTKKEKTLKNIITHVSFYDLKNGEFPGEYVINNEIASFKRNSQVDYYEDSYSMTGNSVVKLIEDFVHYKRQEKLKRILNVCNTKT